MDSEFREAFAQLNARFDKLEARMDAFEMRMDRLETRMDAIETRMDRLETRMDRLETRMDGLEHRVETVERYLVDFRTETINRFDALTHRVDLMGIAITSFDSRLPGLHKAVMGLTPLGETAELTRRVGRLEEQLRDLRVPH